MRKIAMLVVCAPLCAVVAATKTADAFCGFYVGGANAKLFNNATEVVLMRHGTTTVLSMQNNYQGPPEQFALVVPVPVVIKQDQVKTLDRELFEKIDVLGAPRLVEYWEQDPCRRRVYKDAEDKPGIAELSDAGGTDESDDSERTYHVRIEAKFSVGEYNIAVLSARESTGLDRYLRANHYEIPPGAEPLLRPYVEQGTKFFVAKVDPKKVKFVNGMATLSPLRFHYDSPEFVLPVRLGLANSSGTQDLIVNVLAPGDTRYEVANLPNVTIPTNLIVNDEVRTRFGEFYAALFDHAIERVPHAVVTEYAWSSSSCDPCPGPTLDGNDLATLGADVLAKTYRDVHDGGAFTLTRLHARYGKDLKDDLVFRAVEAIVGGRGVPDQHGEVSTKVAANKGGDNQFQGRYIILHPWVREITCENPRRGVWGGPHNGGERATAATNLAFAPRGQVKLASMIAAPVPEIGISESQPRVPGVAQRRGCGGCEAGGGAGAALGGGLALLAIAIRRRRDRATTAR